MWFGGLLLTNESVAGYVVYHVVKIGKLGEDLLDATRLGVGEEDLAEAVACDEADEVFYPSEVEFVEYVVEQQNGLDAVIIKNVLELSEFKSQGESFLLTLRGKLFYGHVVYLEREVVLMRANGGVECTTIGLVSLVEEGSETAILLVLSVVFDGEALQIARNPLVIVVKYGDEPLEKLFTCYEQGRSES